MRNDSFLEKITPSDTKRRLLELRDGWKNEIPEEIVHSSSPDHLYKVRAGWFQWVVICMWRCQWLEQNWQLELSPGIKKEFLEFLASLDDAFRGRRHTSEDIRKWDEIIDKIIAELDRILDPDSSL